MHSSESDDIKALRDSDEKDVCCTDNSCQCADKSQSGFTAVKLFVILSCFLTYFILFGFLNNISTIAANWRNTTGNHILIDQTGSVNFALLYFSSAIVMVIVKFIGYGYTYLLGCLMCCASFLIPYYFPNPLAIFLAYGVLCGTGAGFVLFAMVFFLPVVFKDDLSIANGIIVSGSCIGTLLQAMCLNKFMPEHGWGRIFLFASIIMVPLSLVGLFFKSCEKQRGGEKKKVQNFTDENPLVFPLKNFRFIVFSFGCFLFSLGYLTPFFYLKNYSELRDVLSHQSGLLIGYYSIGSMFGRLMFGFVGNFLSKGRILLFSLCFLFMGIINILAMYCRGYVIFIAYSGALGFFEGGFITLSCQVMIDLVTGCLSRKQVDGSILEQVINSSFAINFMIQSIGMVVGPLIINLFIKQGVAYSSVFVGSGLLFICSAFIVAVNRFV